MPNNNSSILVIGKSGQLASALRKCSKEVNFVRPILFTSRSKIDLKNFSLITIIKFLMSLNLH